MVPPRPPVPRLARDALLTRARAGLDGGLLRVIAAAGYGKSTLLALAVREAPGPVVWCACGVRTVREGPARALAEALGPAVADASGVGEADDPAERAWALGEAVALLAGEDLTIVLDDVHALFGTPAEAELVALVRELPRRARLGVGSRRVGPLGAPRPDAVDLDERHLALTEEECRRLLTALRVDASPEEHAETRRRMEGWVTGILLEARGGGDPLDYLLAEVVDPLREPARRLLEDCSVLDRFTPKIAARVTERDDAAALVGELLEQRAFLVRDGAGWLRHRRLMREALLGRLERERPGSLRGLNARAARALSAAGRHDEAARHHLASGDLTAAIRLLAPRTGDGRRGGGGVGALLGAVPAAVWSDTPGVVLAQASQLFYRADYHGAFAAMEAAVEQLIGEGDHRRAAVTLVRLLRAAPLAGALYEGTITAARRLIAQIGESAEMLPSARVMLALLLAETCRYAEAEEELSAAEATITAGRELTHLHVSVTRAFGIDHPQGRRAPAIAALDAAIAELGVHADADLLHYLLYARGFRAIVLTDTGLYTEAIAEIERLRSAATARGFGQLAVPVVAMLRLGALSGMGDTERLGAELARSAPFFQRLGGALRGYRYDAAAAVLSAAAGDVAGVQRALAGAREGLVRHGLPHDSAMAMVDLSRAAMDVGLIGEARELADAARAQADRAQAPWAGARAAMAAAVAWGPGSQGDAALAEALRRSSEQQMAELWSRRERSMAARLLPRALAEGVGPAEVAVRLAAACGGEVLAGCAGSGTVTHEVRLALAEASAAAVADRRALDMPSRGPAPSVSRADHDTRPVGRGGAQAGMRIVTLGGLAIHRGGERLPDSAFGRQKARVLLAMLACGRGPVHRERLIEALWPSLSEERGLAALHSTLYALRRALEPHAGGRRRSSLVRAEGMTYRLMLGEHDSWDALEFLDAAGAGLAAEGERLPLLLEAERAHGGVLLPEWPFAPWTEPLRTELEEMHRAVLVGIAQELAAAGRASEAASRYRLLIAGEPEREGWHRDLIRVLAESGERALALRQYGICRRLLRDRLGVEPSDETRRLHAQILRDR